MEERSLEELQKFTTTNLKLLVDVKQCTNRLKELFYSTLRIERVQVHQNRRVVL
jgi:hypothetical protein